MKSIIYSLFGYFLLILNRKKKLSYSNQVDNEITSCLVLIWQNFSCRNKELVLGKRKNISLSYKKYIKKIFHIRYLIKIIDISYLLFDRTK